MYLFMQVAVVGMTCFAVASATGSKGLKCKADLVVIDTNTAEVQQNLDVAVDNCYSYFGTSKCSDGIIASDTVLGRLNTTVVNAIPDCGDPSSDCGSDIANVNWLVTQSMLLLKGCHHLCSNEGNQTECLSKLRITEKHMDDAGVYLVKAAGNC
eukprot:TRINITY_DN86_c0_g1_i1.p1 TRINITY_DN86_c0_g1~~TRINITY_DN86_c0_g1_i1.p1  ORF type:complete len:154 (+),score=34.42 TRINITY_DN86_c0_g1_i1:47-508(+)